MKMEILLSKARLELETIPPDFHTWPLSSPYVSFDSFCSVISPQWRGSRKIKVTIAGIVSEPQCPTLHNGNNTMYLTVVARTKWLIKDAQEMVAIDYCSY